MYQENIFTLLFNKLDADHKAYGIRILYEIYQNNNLNIHEIYSKFSNKHQKIIRSSIEDLNKCNLIYKINIENNNHSEKRYALTRFGKMLIEHNTLTDENEH